MLGDVHLLVRPIFFGQTLRMQGILHGRNSNERN